MRLALIATIVVVASAAHAAPSDELDQARSAYRSAQYSRALPLFNALLYPPPPKLAGKDELADAYLALGVCRYETGDPAGAKREFEQALSFNADIRIDPLIVTDPTAIDAFNETRVGIQDRIRSEMEAKRKAEDRARLLAIRQSMVGVESHPLYLTFFPFGVGQFQNEDRAKGVFFAATEAATLITSASIWGYLVNTYGIRSTRVPLEDAQRVRSLQQLEIGTGFAFLGLYVLGVVDAYVHYKPQTRTAIDESVLPPELRGLLKPEAPAPRNKPKKPKTSFHVVPLLTPDGAGIGLSWEN
ncbi:MAG: tetratricopeptide repeat protein [Deltaproteobacteria bacterium]